MKSAIATATAGVASSVSSSAAASITGAAGPTGVHGVSGSSNGSATGASGMPTPSPFTGAAARLGGENLAVVVSILVGAVGMVVMVRL